jgi:alkylation response protein AidB-like acyl-CoA dehydrogenase
MDLALTDEQQLLVRSVATVLRAQCPPARVRAAEPLGFDAALWATLVGLGLPLMSTPVEAGGSGSSVVDMGLVCVELGRQLAPVPLIDTLCAARLLDAAPPADTVLTLALRPAVDGCWELVPSGAIAHTVVGIDGDRLIAVRDDPPTRAQPLANLGCAPLAHRSARAGRVMELGRGEAARARFLAARDQWQVLTAAALVGLAERALALAVDYVQQREQFGVPIATFQTIAHRLADVATSVDGARLLAQKAAWANDEKEPDASALAAMAFLFAAETAEQAAGESLHFHGGYGFTVEYDIQLYYRRAKAWPLVLGSPRRQYRELATALLGRIEG